MRIVTNEKLAKRNRQIATYLFFVTLLVLIGSFFFVNQSLFTGSNVDGLVLLLQAAAIPVAFVLTLFSVRMTNLWARRPRPEEAIEEGLKGLSKKSVLYHYYHIPARHVLICPQGIFAIVTRWHEGKYSVNGDEWRSHQGVFSRLMSAIRMDGLGNPTRDALQAAQHLQSLLKDAAPDADVKPLIVFISPRAELEINDPTVPVLYADPKQKPNLKDYMREINRQRTNEGEKQSDMPLSDEQIEAFEANTIG